MKNETKFASLIMPVAIVGLFLFAKYSQTTVTQVEVQPLSASPQVLGLQTGSIRGIPLEPIGLTPPQFIPTAPIDTAKISARSFYVYDTLTGQVLAEKNANMKTSIASITKLLTAYLAYQMLAVDQSVPVTPEDYISTTPVARLRIGDEVTVKSLIDAIVVGSANDAAKLLGNQLTQKTGQPIGQLMTDTAHKIGMQNSQFSNPLGFDSEDNFSTARDIMILVEALRKYHRYEETGTLKTMTFTGNLGNQYRVRATNKLVGVIPELVSIKTGYTDGALGAMVTQFILQGRTITAIVLGSSNREYDTTELKAMVSANYRL